MVWLHVFEQLSMWDLYYDTVHLNSRSEGSLSIFPPFFLSSQNACRRIAVADDGDDEGR